MKRGFTLLELLVVIAILGMLTTISFLAYNQIRKRALLDLAVDSFAAEVRDMIDQARFGRDSAHCRGLYLAFEKKIVKVEVPSLPLKKKDVLTGAFQQTCDFKQVTVKDVLPLQEAMNLGSLEIGGQIAKEMYVFAEPVTGRLTVHGSVYDQLTFTLRYGTETALEREVTLDLTTGLTQKK